jgi:siroheme synthase
LLDLKNRKAGKRKLPAVAAITAVAAISTATTAASATSTIPTAATTSTASVTTATTTPSRAFCLGARFVDNQVPATEVLTVQAGHRTLRVFIARNFDESETARLARETIANQTDCRGADSNLRKPFLQLFF